MEELSSSTDLDFDLEAWQGRPQPLDFPHPSFDARLVKTVIICTNWCRIEILHGADVAIACFADEGAMTPL